jgi:hypothetical protein
VRTGGAGRRASSAVVGWGLGDCVRECGLFEVEDAGEMLAGTDDVEDAGEEEDGGGCKGVFADGGRSGWELYV